MAPECSSEMLIMLSPGVDVVSAALRLKCFLWTLRVHVKNYSTMQDMGLILGLIDPEIAQDASY